MANAKREPFGPNLDGVDLLGQLSVRGRMRENRRRFARSESTALVPGLHNSGASGHQLPVPVPDGSPVPLQGDLSGPAEAVRYNRKGS